MRISTEAIGTDIEASNLADSVYNVFRWTKSSSIVEREDIPREFRCVVFVDVFVWPGMEIESEGFCRLRRDGRKRLLTGRKISGVI